MDVVEIGKWTDYLEQYINDEEVQWTEQMKEKLNEKPIFMQR